MASRHRTYPGTHPTKGGHYFHPRHFAQPLRRAIRRRARVYVEGQHAQKRLLRKFETAKALMPAPVARPAKRKTGEGVIYFGSSAPAMHEALEALEGQGRRLDALRVRGFPFCDEVYDFVASHSRVYVVEQNRDAQLRTLLVNEGEIDPGKLVPVLHYDGTPITARFIAGEIGQLMAIGQIEAAE